MRFDDRPVAVIDMTGDSAFTAPDRDLSDPQRAGSPPFAGLRRRPLVRLVSFFSSYKRLPDWAPSRAGRPLLACSLSMANAPAAEITNGAARASE